MFKRFVLALIIARLQSPPPLFQNRCVFADRTGAFLWENVVSVTCITFGCSFLSFRRCVAWLLITLLLYYFITLNVFLFFSLVRAVFRKPVSSISSYTLWLYFCRCSCRERARQLAVFARFRIRVAWSLHRFNHIRNHKWGVECGSITEWFRSEPCGFCRFL